MVRARGGGAARPDGGAGVSAPSPERRPVRRFVAIGDSTTEGVGDPLDPRHPATSPLRGWADRLAERLTALEPGLAYANLAVRGRKAREIREEQLGPALALDPDLVAMTGGLNDLVRPKFDLDAVLGELDAMQRAVTAAGGTVLTFTLPDLSAFVPTARPVRGRLATYNAGLHALARRHGTVLADVSARPVAADPRLWAADRLHPNPDGHERLAAAAAEALGLPDAGDGWTVALPPPPPVRLPTVVARETVWTVRFLAPWVGRRLRGTSSGDGRTAKRPALAPVDR